MLKTTLLMGLMTALLLVIGDYIGGSSGMTVMLAFSLISNVLLYWYSDKLVIAQYDARPVDAGSAPQLYGIVQSLARRAQLPMPRVYVVDTALPNAFATGRNPEHAAVCVTTGLMEMLTPREVAGVLGHEMSHVKHNDILISTIAAGMAGIISVMARFAFWFGGDRDDRRNNPLAGILMLVLTPLAAAVIQLAISRTREYMADFTGGQLSGDPDALADALEKIEGYARTRTMPRATEATAHMFIISPFSAKDAQAIFSTHPPTEKRIERLRQEAQEMRSRGMIDPVV
ncbi:zinc metalloprotease HtpX [Acidaminococcus fermentans]|mgnify:FL=1|uniref:Protease HtpX homolog n=2 Tax=Acidaminococcus TaxID=904 RepID=D2RKG5_ACIFV|nr:zinc metalloprotease HtpX [Acidaminococcus fermentans]ADB47567.1 peptidase M48 Ste24p [Acidaminococcus fermentans DSM 20731]MCI6285776.1 zinc metalloprotease HtpX [Acidaminococcus fermentans]MCI7195013.1 zinc metalloprotease HtpX [Acidaminococcus fermentans]MDY2852365.1 zinc metalloprotease HtpX [Acidaminococcus fermentans]UEA71813.1 zinc metalloprotease HtpX [Acidaminococcus fermentans DSM 20731]